MLFDYFFEIFLLYESIISGILRYPTNWGALRVAGKMDIIYIYIGSLFWAACMYEKKIKNLSEKSQKCRSFWLWYIL